MIDLGAINAAFPELKIGDPMPRSGQKDVLRAQLGDTPVALKLIKPAESDAARTAREIQAVATLASAYVPDVFDHGVRRVGQDDRIFIVERFIEGETLRSQLKRSPQAPLQRVLSLADTLLHACLDFERAGLVHRDIKPENIIVGTDGKFWIIDFGIVRFLNQESLTATSHRFGLWTPGYGAPEQMRNLKPEITVRADLFSIGVVLYEMLNGSNPHVAGKQDVLAIVRHTEQQDLPSLSGTVDSELADFLAALTSRFPSRRPQTASEAVDWFEGIARRLRN